MSVFEQINQTSSQAVDKGEEFLKKSHEYYRLKIFQQLTSSVSLLVKAVVVGAFVLVGLLFLAISAAIGIGKALDSVSLGYLIVGAIFILISVLFYMFRSKINNKVIASLSKTFFD
ncbi:hypothetical protein [Mesoflavibacter sp. SCSIO 43206]|uniref:phage holin family protein n=1 Tax=Mesoflavibacter sp. SCSIO 43206 TaxID=2779362 RepID=UPI001CA8DEF0|nr:hypothetical protein [Mesoflavibacter sp. SCSIO 43206]UAB75704.1 phage holin family protein [Mesoflavibacter sp. SCSIO 43206]